VAAWWLLATTYASFWFSVCALIQSFRSSSSTNAVAGAAAWLFFVMVWPVVAQLVASTVAPLPSRTDYDLAKRDAKQHADLTAKADIRAFYEAHPELGHDAFIASEGLSYPTWFVPILSARRSVHALRERFDERLAREQRVARALAVISPALSCFEGLEDAAGQGAARHRRFLRQAEAFDEAYADSAMVDTMSFRRLDRRGLHQLRQFHYREESAGARLGRLTTSFAELSIPWALVLALAWLRLRRQSWV